MRKVSLVMADLASTARQHNAPSIVARALQEGGHRSTRHAANIVFEEFTGVDPYDLPGILIRGGPVESNVGAKRLRGRLAELLHARLAEAGALLGASESRFSRNDNVDREMLDRTHAILDTYMRVAATLGPEHAAKWFNTPHPALDDQAPMQLLKTNYGRKLVDDLVSALHAGSYV